MEHPKYKGLTVEQVAEIQKNYTNWFFSTEHFVKHFMKDDDELKFSVPTRFHRVFDNVPKFQSELFKKIDNIHNLKRVVIASPRSFLKSTSCSIEFPLRCALFGHYKEILIVSNSEALAINFLRSIKINIESNERIHKWFGEQWSDKWTENHIITRKPRVSIRAVGWGAQIRGFRPDLIIMDDIESDETVISEDIRKKMKDWILKAAINSLTVDGALIWVGTLINRVSLLYDWIHNCPPGWTPIFNKAYVGGIEEAGRELWPEVWTHQRLQARKAEIGSYAFSSEFMNEPIPSEGNRFNPNTFQYFEDSDLKGKDTGMYIAIDPAFSEEKTADFGVIMCVLHDSEDNIYAYHMYRERTNSRKLIDEFKRIYSMYRPQIRAVGVESAGTQKSFYDQLVSECMASGLYPPIKKMTGVVHSTSGNKRNKNDRITYMLQPRFEAKKIFLRRDQYALIDELTLFPECKHDDAIDALAYAASLIEPLQSYEEKMYDDVDNFDEMITHGTTGYGDNESYGKIYE